ncbi:MAG: histidine phosphatase family protein [Gammaproteobacteria bacterium]|nr:MAG: histidine phosphatase family protein [Gammaproteobacteria bacterium]
MTETIIDLLRHGEPQGGSRYRGHAIDDPLSAKGWLQMAQGVGEFRDWSRVISSPLCRCHDFARSLADELCVKLDIDERFREIGFGAWEGRTRQQLRIERADEFDAFYRDPVNNTPQGAEPVADFYQRIAVALDDVLAQYRGEHLLIVAHAGVIRAALVYTIGAPVDCMYNFRVLNGRISRLRHSAHHSNLELVNARL